jgi:hypothetical protein
MGRRPWKILPHQFVDASMSSSELVSSDVVLPGGLIVDHGPVDDIDEVAMVYARWAAISEQCIADLFRTPP